MTANRIFWRSLRLLICSTGLLILYFAVFYNPPKAIPVSGEGCCFKNFSPMKKSDFESTCSDEATAMGKGQKVIAFSIYAHTHQDTKRYVTSFKPNLDIIPKLYPGWVVRVYTDIPRSKWCKHLCQHDFLYWCNVNNLPGLGNLTLSLGTSWRFLPIGDPLVDIFISRDSDSLIYPRERAPVQEWENSYYTIHAMRDHPYQGVPLLAGMWGAKNTLLGPERSNRLHLSFIEVSPRTFDILMLQLMCRIQGAKKSNARGHDQTLLSQVIYRELSNETMAHDSYLCGKYPDGITLGFPTRRENGRYVGSILDNSLGNSSCPKKCRRHVNWTQC